MGLLFSKFKKAAVAPQPPLRPLHRSADIDDINAIVQGPNHHIAHPSTVSYDFNTTQGQMRAILAWEAEKDKEECIKKPANTGKL